MDNPHQIRIPLAALKQAVKMAESKLTGVTGAYETDGGNMVFFDVDTIYSHHAKEEVVVVDFQWNQE